MNRQATAVMIAVAVVAPLACGLAVLGGIGSFATVRHLATPWFGKQAWIIPVGIDIGILALLAWDLLDEYVGLPWPPLRWTAWAFIAATIYLNVTAAHGSPNAAVMHTAMPVLFITVVEGVRHLIRQSTGLASGTRIERIPAARWILAPRSSFLLFRQMVLWQVTTYYDGLALEHRRLQAIARLQMEHGHYLWRWRAPLHERLALRPGPANTQESTGHIGERDQRLVDAAAGLLQEARGKGAALSQASLARALREQGIPVANGRLQWLTGMAEAAIASNGQDGNQR